SAVVFVFFFMLIFLTIQYWFPYLSKGHDLIVRGPFEVIRFYIRTAGALGLGLSLPFICRFLWQFMKPGLVDKETQFLKSYFPLMFLLFLGGLSFGDRKSTRLNSSHVSISYAVFCLKKKNQDIL